MQHQNGSAAYGASDGPKKNHENRTGPVYVRLRRKLKMDDILIALTISAEHNEKAQKAIEQLPNLAGLEAHSTFLLSPSEEQAMKKLKL